MQVTGGCGATVARIAAACALLRAGQVLLAQRQLTEVAANLQAATVDDVDNATLLAALVDCRLARGQLSEAAAQRVDLMPIAERAGVAGAIACFSLAEIAAAHGDPERAIALYLRAGERAGGLPVPPDVAPWRAGAVLTMVRTGRRDVRQLAVDHHQEAIRSGSPYAIALSLRALANADAAGQRLRLLRDARSALSGVVASRLAAQIDTDIAGLLMLGSEPDDEAEAAALLRSAERFAGQQELWPLQSRVHRLLERLGEKPRPARTEAVASLTRTELRVAGLAADGLTNRQIADQLIVSVKAVEWHLSRSYRKLGIRSRQGLAPALGTTG